MGADEFAVLRRYPLVVRVAARAGAVVCAYFGLRMLLEGSPVLWARIIAPLVVLVAAWTLWTMGQFWFRADDAGVSIHRVRTVTLPWSDVTSIEPSHDGFVFRLTNGRRQIAPCTAKSTLRFLKPRYDAELLASLRSRIGGA